MFRREQIKAALGTIALACGLCAHPAPATAQSATKELTVERIWSPPSLSGHTIEGIEWSPDGKMLGFLHATGQGAATEFMVIDAGTGERRVLISAEKLAPFREPPRRSGPVTAKSQATGPGRISPKEFLWAPNSNAIVFVTSTGLYWFDLKTQTGRALTGPRQANSINMTALHASIFDPKISPDGQSVSFTRADDLVVVNAATGKETELTHGGREEIRNATLDWVYPEELDLQTAYWWSPDSSKIAYLQFDERNVTRYPMVDYLTMTGETNWERYPKAGHGNPVVRVGVVNVAGASAPAAGPRTHWMNTGADQDIYIPRVAWLPDSQAVAIERLNRAQNKLELLFVSTATGRSQTVITEEDKYWINVHDDPYFLADGKRFLWESERDGFPHLYLYSLQSITFTGGQSELAGQFAKLDRQVTRGAWEVTGVEGVDETKGLVYFTSTEKSPTERHLYVTSLEASRAPERLTQNDGTHAIQMSPDCAHFVDTYSNTLTPPQLYLNTSEGKRVAVLEENRVNELADYGLVAPHFYTVPGADGTPLNAMVTLPPDFTASRKYPVIVYLYGGPESQVVVNAWGGAIALWHQMMARKGFVILSLDNRGMAAHGHAFETAVYHHFGRDALADQLAGLDWLKSMFPVDESRIGIWGWSFGGFMTCYAMLNAPEVFKIGFAGSPVTDWREYDTIYTERYMGRPQENEDGYRDSSPVNQAANLKGKLMIAYGTGDDNVHFANTMELAEQFIRAGKYADLYPYPNRGHGISDTAARIHLFNRVTQYFLDTLK